ncbi:MAG: hypothetical protein MJ252_30495 [archaeon]|nr:hypothetical protein [archaeon]
MFNNPQMNEPFTFLSSSFKKEKEKKKEQNPQTNQSLNPQKSTGNISNSEELPNNHFLKWNKNPNQNNGGIKKQGGKAEKNFLNKNKTQSSFQNVFFQGSNSSLQDGANSENIGGFPFPVRKERKEEKRRNEPKISQSMQNLQNQIPNQIQQMRNDLNPQIQPKRNNQMKMNPMPNNPQINPLSQSQKNPQSHFSSKSDDLQPPFKNDKKNEQNQNIPSDRLDAEVERNIKILSEQKDKINEISSKYLQSLKDLSKINNLEMSAMGEYDFYNFKLSQQKMNGIWNNFQKDKEKRYEDDRNIYLRKCIAKNFGKYSAMETETGWEMKIDLTNGINIHQSFDSGEISFSSSANNPVACKEYEEAMKEYPEFLLYYLGTKLN